MALINCPECEHQVSEKAETCPNCGFSIENYLIELNKENKKQEELEKLHKDKKKKIEFVTQTVVPEKYPLKKTIIINLIVIALAIIFFIIYKNIDTHAMLNNFGLWLIYIISKILNIVFGILSLIFIWVSVTDYIDYKNKKNNFNGWKENQIQKIENEYKVYEKNIINYGQRVKPLPQNSNNTTNNTKDEPLKCPRCGSTAITTGQRGFSIFSGFWGSNKTVNRCGKCGYSWEPHK